MRGRFFLTPESPEWDSYAAKWRAANRKATGPPTGRDGGWWFVKGHSDSAAQT